MRGALKALSAVAAVATAGVVWGGVSVSAASPTVFTCSGTFGAPETIAGGTYIGVTLPAASFCEIVGPGLVNVRGPVTLGAGAGLVMLGGSLAVSGAVTVGPDAAFGAPTNETPVNLRGPVSIGWDGAFILGTETPYGPDFASIHGPIQAVGASSLQIHNTAIFGPVTMMGGGGDNTLVDAVSASFGYFGPNNFNDLEDNRIRGPVTEEGYYGVWAGVLRDVISGAFTFSNNSEAPYIDEYDIGSDMIGGPATCNSNDPVPNTGASAGSPSIVGGPTGGNQAATCTGIAGGESGPPV